MSPSRALGAVVVARAVSMTGAFAFSVTCLRVLSVAHAGLVLLIYTLITVAATVARFGADTYAMREAARSGASAGSLVRHAATVPLIVGPPAAAVLAGAVVLQARGTAPDAVAWLAALAVLPAASSVVSGAALRGLGRVGAGTLAELGSSVWVASALLVALAASGRADAVGALAALTAGYLITAAWSWAMVAAVLPSVGGRHGGPGATLGFLRRERRSLVGFFAAAIGSFLFVWLPVLVLGYTAPPLQAQAHVAIFNAGARPAQFVSLLALIQASYLGPRFARLYRDGDLAQLTSTARRAVLLSGSWAAALATVALVAPQAILWIFREELRSPEAEAVLQVLSVGGLLVVLVGPVAQVMLVVGRERTAGGYTFVLLGAGALVLTGLASRGPVAVAAGSAVFALGYALACWVRLARDGIQAGPVSLPVIGRR